MYLWFKSANPKSIFITGIQLAPHREHGAVPLEKLICECCTKKYLSTSTANVEILTVYHNRAEKRTVRTTHRIQNSRPGGTYTYHSLLKG
jgi:hypothetical protein